jgi:hypothetical protein
VGAVVDAGPLIHLKEASCLDLLTVFGPLYAPEEVWNEVARQDLIETDLAGVGLERTPHPDADDLRSYIEELGIESLDRGEQECLHLCRRLSIAIFLTDDLAARDAAKRLGLVPVGSLGVIVRAYRRSRISLSDAERLMRRLQEASSLFVTMAIIDIAIEQLRSEH